MPTHTSWPKLIGMTFAIVAMNVQPAPADGKETPESFVRRVYARYRTDGPGVPTARPGGAMFYAAPLLDAFAKDEALAHGEVGTIDGDPLCGCQDFGKLKVTGVVVTPAGTDAVKAQVAFVNLGSPVRVTLTLVTTPAGWRIADVADKDVKSLMALLHNAAAQASQPARPSDSQLSPKP